MPHMSSESGSPPKRPLVRESVTLAGPAERAERAGVARIFVGVVLAGHPCGDVAVLQGAVREQRAAAGFVRIGKVWAE